MPTLDIKLIDLPKITDPRGNLTIAEGAGVVPFDIKQTTAPGGRSIERFVPCNPRQWLRTADGVAEPSLAGTGY